MFTRTNSEPITIKISEKNLVSVPASNKYVHCTILGTETDLFEEYFSQNTEKHNGSVRCLICGKVTIMVGNMKQHFEVHHFQREFSCDFCGKVFKTRNSLCVHKRSKHWGAGALQDKR